jgi:LacI family transcriptional regulator, galactose operon repressor
VAPRKRSGQTPTGSEPPRKPVTLKFLAERLGLSPATVSLVVNDAPAAESIPDKTKERVRAAAREFGYRPNLLARSLRSKRSFSIGVLLPEISEGYAASVLGGVDEHLTPAGYFFLVAAHRNKPELLQEYVGLLMDRGVEGFVLVNTPIEQPLPLPTVVVSGHRKLEGVTNVTLDHDLAAKVALSHLAELGHTRIAFFKGHKKSSDTEDRWRSIQRAARALRIEVLSDLTLQLEGDSWGGTFTPEEGYKEGYVFGSRLLARRVPFTGLFAFNDLSAIGAMRAFREAGLHVPQDISVIGFDDIQSAAFQNPSLTTVRQPLREMGEIAALTLLRRLHRDETLADTVTVEPQLMVRESTAPPPAHRKERGRPRSGTLTIS